MKTINELITQYSLDPTISEQNRATIMDIGEALRQVVNENFPQLRYPVIAGGAIRDTIFGLPIKDFDIFFDSSVFDDNEREDIALLLIAIVCEKLRQQGYPDLRNCRFSVVGNNSNYTIGEDENSKTPFIVYENYFDASPDLGVPLNLDGPPPYTFPVLQVIGHKDDRLRIEPVEFLEYFDYGLVRGLFDPTDMVFKLHPSLEQTLILKKIPYNNSRTFDRVNDLFGKMSRFPRGFELATSFKMVNTRPDTTPCVTNSSTRMFFTETPFEQPILKLDDLI